ncbi:MAG: protein phosphatase 2C domain-containing protein [Terriglobia bacterium]
MLRSYRGSQIEGAGSAALGQRPAHSSMLDVEFAQLSDAGRVRKHNEDHLGYVLPASAAEARTHGWLFALADGVGGHAKGEVASRLAVESVLSGFREAPAGESHSSLLQRLVQSANTRVFETGLAAGSGGASMSTTLVACALRFDQAAVAHVGDSRCYLVRRGHATRLTRDHTVASEQVRLGVLSAQEAAQAPTRHVLSRALGADLFVGAEINDHKVLAGDVVVLCCDGLHGAVSAADIAHVTSHAPDLNAAAQKLVALANERDGSDNISVQLIRVRSVERVGMYRGRPYKLH